MGVVSSSIVACKWKYVKDSLSTENIKLVNNNGYKIYNNNI